MIFKGQISIIIPKYFVSFIIFIFCLLIQKFTFFFIIVFCVLVKRTISVFLVLREILFALSQWTIFFSSKFIFWLDLLLYIVRDLLEYSKFVSAKWCISACFVTWCRSGRSKLDYRLDYRLFIRVIIHISLIVDNNMIAILTFLMGFNLKNDKMINLWQSKVWILLVFIRKSTENKKTYFLEHSSLIS